MSQQICRPQISSILKHFANRLNLIFLQPGPRMARHRLSHRIQHMELRRHLPIHMPLRVPRQQRPPRIKRDSLVRSAAFRGNCAIFRPKPLLQTTQLAGSSFVGRSLISRLIQSTNTSMCLAARLHGIRSSSVYSKLYFLATATSDFS